MPKFFAILSVVTFCFAAALPAHASPYKTVHADMIFVTPYALQVRGDLGDFSAPQDGYMFLVVSLQAANHNDVPLSIGSNEFNVIGTDGQVQDSNFESPTPVFGGTLIPGASMKGTITFQVPKGSHTAQLRWVTNTYDSSWPTFVWKLKF